MDFVDSATSAVHNGHSETGTGQHEVERGINSMPAAGNTSAAPAPQTNTYSATVAPHRAPPLPARHEEKPANDTAASTSQALDNSEPDMTSRPSTLGTSVI